MLKEQVVEILLQLFNEGFVMGEIGVGNDQEATDEALEAISSLFKAEVDKLTVIDDEEVKTIVEEWYKTSPLYEALVIMGAKEQLQHTKKQLLEGM